MRQSELDAIVDEVAKLATRNVSIDDTFGRVLAYNTGFPTLDQARIDAVLRKTVAPEVQAWETLNDVTSQMRPFIVPANTVQGYLARLCIPVINRGLRLGYIWILARDTDDDLEPLLGALDRSRKQLAGLAERLEHALESSAESDEHSDDLRHLLSTARNNDAGDEIHSAFPADAELKLYVFHAGIVRGLSPTQQQRLMMLAADDAARALKVFTIRAEYRDHVVLLSNLLTDKGAHQFAEKLEQAIARRVIDRSAAEAASGNAMKLAADPVCWGTTEAFAEYCGIPRSYREAIACVQAQRVDPAMSSHDYRRIGVYQFLARVAEDPEAPSKRYHDIAQSRQGTVLLETLEKIYDADANRQELANELHLHRTTLYTRLQRIATLIADDPMKPDVRLELHLEMKRLRWRTRPRLARP